MSELLDFNARILVVDDEPENLRLLERILKREGIENITTASDGQSALNIVDDFEPDLILLDLHMPHMGGFEVLEQLRSKSSPDSFLPVLVLTGDPSGQTKRRALSAGAIDFLTKPFDVTEVRLRVRNLLRTRLLHTRMEALVDERTRALDQAQLEVLERLALAGEFRDDDTGHHAQRVGEMAGLLASALGLSEHQVELIRRTAPLHDIGKIGIPDVVMLKPGKLTEEEWTAMKRHTLTGAEILTGGRTELVRMAEEIARSHHERWDGTGYPQGLAREEIPLTARIVAIADVFDALSHDRPYRCAWRREDVVAEIESGRGSHFDPTVADAFLSLVAGEGFGMNKNPSN